MTTMASFLWAPATCCGCVSSPTSLYNPTREVLVLSPLTDEKTEVQVRNVCKPHSHQWQSQGLACRRLA